jgi:hypothetical protein
MGRTDANQADMSSVLEREWACLGNLTPLSLVETTYSCPLPVSRLQWLARASLFWFSGLVGTRSCRLVGIAWSRSSRFFVGNGQGLPSKLNGHFWKKRQVLLPFVKSKVSILLLPLTISIFNMSVEMESKRHVLRWNWDNTSRVPSY